MPDPAMTQSDVLLRITVPKPVLTAALVNNNRSALRAYLKAQACAMVDEIEQTGDLEKFVYDASSASVV